MNDSSKLVKNTAIYAIGDILPRVFNLITFPVLTSSLPPSEYGIINYVATIDNFASIICLLALSTYYLVYYFRVGDEVERRKLLGNLSIFLFGFNLIVLSFFLLIGPWLFGLWDCKVDFYPYIALGLTNVVLNIIPIMPSALYRAMEKPLPLTILNALRGFLSMGLTVVFVLYVNKSALGVMWARTIVGAVFALIFMSITIKNSIFSFNWNQIREALKFSLPLVPGAIAYYLYSMFDRILIERYLSLTELGLYSTAATLALLLNVVSNGAYKAFEPYFFKTFGTDSFNYSFAKVRDILLAVTLSGGMCLAVFSKEFFKIFSSPAYATAFHYVPIIVIGAVASAMSQMYSTVVTARNKTKINARITIVGAAFSIALNILLLRYIGIWAAAIVFSLAFILVLYLGMHFAKVDITHAKPIIVSVACFVVMFLLTYLPIEEMLLSIPIKIVGVLLTCFVMFKIMKVDAKAIVLQFFKKNKK